MHSLSGELNIFLAHFAEGMIKESQKIRKRVEVILSKGDKILIGRMSGNKPIFPGGGVDPGESIMESGKREVLEEAGYQPKNLKRIHNEKLDFTYGRGKHNGDRASTSFLYGQVGKKDNSLLGADGDALDVEFMEVDKLINNLSSSKGRFARSQKRRAKILEKIKEEIRK